MVDGLTGVIRLDFNSGKVVKELAELPERIYVATLEVLKERAELMVGLAKVYVRVETGSLRDSIRMQWIGTGRRVCTVRAGGYVTNPQTGKIVNYAVHVEQRFPFMEPAWNEAKQGIEDMIEAKVLSAVSQ